MLNFPQNNVPFDHLQSEVHQAQDGLETAAEMHGLVRMRLYQSAVSGNKQTTNKSAQNMLQTAVNQKSGIALIISFRRV